MQAERRLSLPALAARHINEFNDRESYMNKLFALLIIPAALLLTACGSESEDTAEAVVETDSISTAVSEDEMLYLDASEELIGRFQKELQTELLAALNTGGPVNAISVCQDKAPAIAERYSVGGWSIKRVTDRFRNPDNRADSLEMSLLAGFADTSGTTPEYQFDWYDEDSLTVFRYAKPITIKPLCLKCHGGLQTLGPGVYETLNKRYPLDRAIEYQVGDLRGMFVVEAHWPEGKEQAALLVNDMITSEPSDSVPAPDQSQKTDQ